MATTRAPALGSERLLNRELSRLEFDARVLEQAADPTVPLLERVKFCAFVSSNLDEFFQVRVAGLTDQAASGLPVRSADGLTPQETLAAVRSRVSELTARQSRLWRRELCPALAEQGIPVGSIDDCSKRELAELESRFERETFPVLTPLGVGPGQPFPFISPLSLSLGVLARDPKSGEERFARVKVPEGLQRFVTVGTRGLLLQLEQVISHFLTWLFPGMEVEERAAFRVTRDADFEVSDEADDLLGAVQAELRRRRFGEVVRLEVASSMSNAMLERLRDGLRVDEDQVYRVNGPLDLADLTQIVSLERPELKYELWAPVTQARIAPAPGGRADIFGEIRRGDILVHHPYESFATSFEAFVRAAARDPEVIGMKTAVYRTSGDTPLVPALVEAAEQGKQSVCLVEIKARFDERRNIEWSQALEQAGVHVVYGFPNLKIHAKTTLVMRREGDRLRRYVHIGTGNYHALTARLYEDVGLFTADEEIAADVADLFNYLTGFGRPQRFRKILVAPFTLRTRLIEEIRAVAQAGAEGSIRIKVNALTDPPIIEELYRASQAGARVDIVARSICALRPGVEGLSETIRVRSIVGRFLEHSRLFSFAAGDETRYFLGSADLMPRNLDHRIEIVVPVENGRAQGELNAIFEAALADNSQAWKLGPDGVWSQLAPKKGERQRMAQTELMRRARSRSRRQAEYRTRGR
ncbi:MAG: polyphosphate kinase 1 [Actinobacteria bacterium]|nr:polyphosphate kinase 1 [Actinomycetota bacterium]